MGFWGDVAGAADDVFGGVKNVTETVGGDALKVVGMVGDAANTVSGGTLGDAVNAMNTAYEYAIDRPVSTFEQMAQHAQAVENQNGFGASVGAFFNGDDWAKAWNQSKDLSLGQGAMFAFSAANPNEDPLQVGAQQAYANSTAEHPTLAGIGATAVDLGVGFRRDPTVGALKGLGYVRRVGTAGATMSTLQAAQNFGVSADRVNQWADRVLSAKVLSGKGYGDLTDAERAKLPSLLDPSGPGPKYMLNRMNNFLDRINGTGVYSDLRPLTSSEIFQYSKFGMVNRTIDGRAISSLLEDSRRLSEDPEVVAGVQRQVLGVALGNTDEIEKVRSQLTQAGAVRDALKNMLDGGTLNLDHLATDPAIADNPLYHLEIERQLKNLDQAGKVPFGEPGAIDNLVDHVTQQWTRVAGTGIAGRADQVGIQGLSAIPGVSQRGERVMARSGQIDENGVAHRALDGDNVSNLSAASKAMALPGIATEHLSQGLRDFGADGGKLDEWSQKWAAKGGTASTVFQNGAYSMPLMMVKGLDLTTDALAWGVDHTLGAPFKLATSARLTHFTGLANLNDWNYATQQLETQMHLARMPYQQVRGLLGEAFGAATEEQKMQIIQKVEHQSLHSLADHYNALNPDQEIDKDYLTQIFNQHMTERNRKWAAMVGRQYASTEMDDTGKAILKARADAINNALDREREATLHGTGKIARKWVESKPYTVDTVLDGNGMPIHLPLLPSQLGNTVPLANMHLFDVAMRRDQNFWSRTSKAWASARDDFNRASDLSGIKPFLGGAGQRAANVAYRTMDALETAGRQLTNMWKWGTLFRLGYPIRFLMDDDMRVLTYLGGAATSKLAYQGLRNYISNNGHKLDPQGLISGLTSGAGITRRAAAAADVMSADMYAHDTLASHLESEWATNYDERMAQVKQLNRQLRGHHNYVSGLNAKLSMGDISPEQHAERVAAQQAKIAGKQEHLSDLQDQLGDPGAPFGFAGHGPKELQADLDMLKDRLRRGIKGYIDEIPKQRLGESPIFMPDGTQMPGAYEGAENVYAERVKMNPHLETSMRDIAEQPGYTGGFTTGSFKSITPADDHHIQAWQNALNFQIKNDPVARFFLEGGDEKTFARWIKKPEQAPIRERMAFRSSTPDHISLWGHSVNQVLHDYIPNSEVQQALRDGKNVTADMLRDVPERDRPVVHGASLSDTMGNSPRVGAMNRFMNRSLAWLSDAPTDTLSRHPFFVGMYKQHAEQQYSMLKAQRDAAGKEFTEADRQNVASVARKQALNDVKTTLFDMSAHSHLAHVLRFISPFYAAHQMVLSRWFRVGVQEHPEFLRQWTMPMFNGLENAGFLVDKNGQPLKHGDPIDIGSASVLLQLPSAWGGPDPRKYSGWKFALNAANVIMPNGLNPGVGPVVQVPAEQIAKDLGDPRVSQWAKVFDPYPTGNPMDSVLPSWMKNAAGVLQAKTGLDVPFLNDAHRYTGAVSQNAFDMQAQFVLQNGREPTQSELETIMQGAQDKAKGQMVARWASSMLSPVSVQPQSRYAAIQNGFNLIREQVMSKPEFAKNPNAAYDLIAYAFMKKYGDVMVSLMPKDLSASDKYWRESSLMDLISKGNYANPAGIQSTTAEQDAIMKYQPLLKGIDPSLTRMVTGPYADALVAQDPMSGQISPYTSAWLKDNVMQAGSTQDYLSEKDPLQAAQQRSVSDGWDQYSQLTNYLVQQANARGEQGNWRADPSLKALHAQALQALEQRNQAWSAAFQQNSSMTPAQFEGLVGDMKKIVSYPALANDPARAGDIGPLRQYLELRSYVDGVLQQRANQGYGSYTSTNNRDLIDYFAQAVAQLETNNPMFQQYAFNGVVNKDPYLKEAEKTNTGLSLQLTGRA